MSHRPLIATTAALAATLGSLATGLPGRCGLDVRAVPAAHRVLAAEAAREAVLEDSLHDLAHRHAAGNRVVARLADGHLPLADAAADLEALHADSPDYLAGLRTLFSGATDRERFARSAVERVRLRHPERVGRVEAEFAALYPPAD